MNYQLLITENLPLGIKRIAAEQVNHALQSLEGFQDNKDEAIHELRKSFKKLRAMLRLVRGELGEALYRVENDHYRDLGRSISALRDASAMIETLEKVKADFDQHELHEAYLRLRKYLLANRRKVTHSMLHLDDERTRVKLMLQEGLERIDTWPLEKETFKAIAPGLLKVYTQGCDAMQLAYQQASVPHFHDWRKRAKYLRYQLDILQPLWPGMFSALEQEIHNLTDLLGLDHDLAVLGDILHLEEASLEAKEAAAIYNNIIAPQRMICQGQAQRLGARIYQESPKAYVKRLKGYFQIWKGMET